jgi:hypothetical protein
MKGFICLFLLCNTVLFAQSTKPKTNWAIGVLGTGATTYCFTGADGTSGWLKNEIDSSETWSTGYSYGISADYFLSEKLSLRSGLTFSQCGQSYQYLSKYQSFRTAYQFIDIPAIVRYAHPLEKANLVFGIGPELTYMLRSRAIYQGIGDLSINKTTINDASLSKLGVAIGTQISYNRLLGAKTNIELGLNYRQQITSIAKGSITRLPFSLGLFLGIRQGI